MILFYLIKGASSGWFLDNIHIQRHAIQGSKRLKKHQSNTQLLYTTSESTIQFIYEFIKIILLQINVKFFKKDMESCVAIQEKYHQN